MELKYMLAGSIIDWFSGSLNDDELLKANVLGDYDFMTSYEGVNVGDEVWKIEELKERIKKSILKNKYGGEDPHTIRYFFIPSCYETSNFAAA